MENQDSVCYVNKIVKIEQIVGADKIELATINGWTSIVQKGIYKEGDRVICLTTDAVIPREFGEKHGILNYLRSGNRVRTIKLKGVYSDCIVLPLSSVGGERNRFEGEDLQKILNIFKYEEPVRQITLAGGRRVLQRDNPNFNKYYKFPNIKNVPDIFNEEDEVVITRKIHGTNARYGIVKKVKLSLFDRIKKLFGNKWVGYEYVYGSHNVLKGSDTNGFYSTDVWRTVAEGLKLKEDLWTLAKYLGKDQLGSGIIFYGEIFGAGIQGEKYTYGCIGMRLNVFDVELNKEYLDREAFDLITKDDFETVPVLYRGKYSKEIVDSFVLNQFIEGTKIPHEGVVISHVSGDRKKIAKVINPDYLIYSEKFLIPDSH